MKSARSYSTPSSSQLAPAAAAAASVSAGLLAPFLGGSPITTTCASMPVAQQATPRVSAGATLATDGSARRRPRVAATARRTASRPPTFVAHARLRGRDPVGARVAGNLPREVAGQADGRQLLVVAGRPGREVGGAGAVRNLEHALRGVPQEVHAATVADWDGSKVARLPVDVEVLLAVALICGSGASRASRRAGPSHQDAGRKSN